MKKQLLLLTIFVMCRIWCFGQPKAQPVTKGNALKSDTSKVKPAPIYQPDLTSKHDITLKGITAQQLNDWVIYATNGPEVINNSDKISAKQSTDITKDYLFISTSLKNQLDTLLAKDKLKWQADTAKKGRAK